RTFSSDGEVDRLVINNPRKLRVVGRLGPKTTPDDMTIDAKGILWIASFAPGKIFRLNPHTHHSCAIASGLQAPTAVLFGGRGWHAHHLYVTGAGGDLYELTPPRTG